MSGCAGLEVFEEYFGVVGKLYPDCVSFSKKDTTFKKSKQLHVEDFYIISNAALQIASEIRRRQRAIGG